MNDRTVFINMVKSAVELLATDKFFKNGFLTGMILAKKLADKKKNSMKKGGKKIQGGFSFKKELAIAAGPLGWVWLARHKNDEELNEVKKRLEKYEPPETTMESLEEYEPSKKTKKRLEPPKKTKKGRRKTKKEKVKKIDDFPVDNDDDIATNDFPMETGDDFDLDDFE